MSTFASRIILCVRVGSLRHRFFFAELLLGMFA
ncbi:hypothetical protein HDE76_003364 [Rhodanobacter sp. ANJX3]|nr:hypothetical protein [Rhodanobacter sp. ANJX3]